MHNNARIVNFMIHSRYMYKNTMLPIEEINVISNKSNKLLISFEADIKNPDDSLYTKLYNDDVDEYKIFANINDIDKVYLRDLNNAWYVRGLKYELLNSVDKCIEFLSTIVCKYTHVYIIGFSMGGYAAILYGKLLSIMYPKIKFKILALSPKTCLLRYINYLDVLEYKKKKQHPILIKNKFDSWLFKTLRSNVWPYIDNIDYRYLDLIYILSCKNINFYCECWCSTGNRVDMYHLDRIKEHIYINYVNADKLHLILKFLRDTNVWDSILYKFLNE